MMYLKNCSQKRASTQAFAEGRHRKLKLQNIGNQNQAIRSKKSKHEALHQFQNTKHRQQLSSNVFHSVFQRAYCTQFDIYSNNYANYPGKNKRLAFKQKQDLQFYRNLIFLSKKNEFDSMLNTSFKNYHVKGFNSIILSSSPSLTLRLYVVFPHEADLQPESESLFLHNHHFDFQTQVLIGEMQNARFRQVQQAEVLGLYPTRKEFDSNLKELYLKENPHSSEWYEYVYHSPLLGNDSHMKLSFKEKILLENIETETIQQGQSYMMQSEEIHKIHLHKAATTMLLFWEHTAIQNIPRFFAKSPQPEFPEVDHLYKRFERKELESFLDRVIDGLQD